MVPLQALERRRTPRGWYGHRYGAGVDGPELVLRFFAAYNAGAVDEFDSVVAEDYVLNQSAVGREQLKAFVIHLRTGFPDDEIRIEDLVTEGDRVVARLEATGTHSGPHPMTGAPATNKTKTSRGIYIFRIADGRIAEAWDVWDLAGELVQLGLV